MYEPTMHKMVPMNSRVWIPWQHFGKPVSGTVVGISSYHDIFNYIILLDISVPTPYGDIRAASVPGTELVGIDGRNWKLDQ